MRPRRLGPVRVRPGFVIAPVQMARFLLITALAFFLGSCREERNADQVLARIGDKIITVEEFRLNYAFGHGHLRRGEDPRRVYLNLMIREKALALKAEDANLDTAQAVMHGMRTLREELLIERVFEEKVLATIDVTDDEIREEINRAAVRFRFRFLPARTEAEAHDVREKMHEKGFARVWREDREAFAELDIAETELTSPLLGADEIDPAVLEVLKDLDIHTPSEPMEYKGHWYVFEVIDIQRSPLSEVSYAQGASTYRKRIYNRKALAAGQAYVVETMEPLKVTTKRPGFEVLNETLWEWYRARAPQRNVLHYIDDQKWDGPHVRQLVEHYDTELVHFGNERWTIYTFLKHFTPGRYVLRARDPAAFRARLADVVALVVRDAVLLRIAGEERLDRQPQFQRSLELWRDQWMFQEYRRQLLAAADTTDSAVKAYYDHKESTMEGSFYPYEQLDSQGRDKARNRMMQEWMAHYADSTAALYDISINEVVLDTLTMSTSRANPYLTVHLLKSNSNKMPFPIVDPGWRSAVVSGGRGGAH